MPADYTIACQARAHQNQLTKPQGALGRLEELACWFAARQEKVIPDQLQPGICVFAGDHGVVAEGVSAFPSVVTMEMLKNFTAGGAAISVLARQHHACLRVVDIGVAGDSSGITGVVQAKVRPGTGNLRHEAAMSHQEYQQALAAGRQQTRELQQQGANVLIAGDMGIGNTTASACLICALTSLPVEYVVGYGTGIDELAHARKLEVVASALERVRTVPEQHWPAELGGLEIAAMAGFYLQAAEDGIPVILDGFIAAAAALVARYENAAVSDMMLASHVSQELGHRAALQTLGLEPLFDLGMRLGEGTGAALALPLLQSALALHREMATFADAEVSERMDD